MSPKQGFVTHVLNGEPVLSCGHTETQHTETGGTVFCVSAEPVTADLPTAGAIAKLLKHREWKFLQIAKQFREIHLGNFYEADRFDRELAELLQRVRHHEGPI